MTNANALPIQERLRAAFDADDVAEKNLALRAGHDRIDALEKALREIADLERTAYSLRAADDNFKAAGKFARAALGDSTT